MSICSVDGCGKVVNARGLCAMHYMQQRRAGLVPVGTRARGSLEERFWRFVDTSGDCWLWVGGSASKKGYGLIQEGGKGSPHLLAHRVSYRIHYGEIPDGMVVMHKCDNPRCVNPAHLRVGTASENIKEAYEKRRKVSNFKKGTEHHAAVLNEGKVRFIRANRNISQAKLAKMLGCSRSAVSGVLDGRTWVHIA